jgi:RNA-directed DNA polymerase
MAGRGFSPLRCINKKGERKLNPVKWLTDTKTVRYAKVKYGANPYDTEWKEYFEERKTRLMLSSAKDKKSILAIWNRQGKKYPHCNERITSDTPWRVSERIANGIASRCPVHNYCGGGNVESENLEEYEPVSE